MTDDTRNPNRTASTRIRTRATAGDWRAQAAALRVPGLTILFHPDVERMGERATLAGLTEGSVARLSRHAPDFAAPGGDRARPLGDASLSRTPVTLAVEGDRMVVDRGESRTRVRWNGRQVEARAEAPLDALEAGVVLLLSHRVVLLLHLLDPVADRSTPRFGLVGESPALAQVRRDVVQTADLDVPILLRGESGTGKELVARGIHDAGPRRHRPFVALNMAAVPPNLAASELFGAEKGAYTGAERRRSGHFQRAHGGTLFLDEIGETPPEVQALLLRALETGEVQAVGGERPEVVDVRIVSATDADLESAIEEDRFRGPLLHRLSGYLITLPPLRERREDFGRLLAHFLRRELAALGMEGVLSRRPDERPWLPAELVARLAAWHWPGNVRQLGNVVRQLVIANRGEDPATRFEQVEKLLEAGEPGPPGGREGRQREPGAAPRRSRKPADLREEDVVAALREHRFRPAAAADALGIPRSSIYDLMDKIPGLRTAGELSAEEIEAVRVRVGPSVEAMAEELEVSERALRRRIGELKQDAK